MPAQKRSAEEVSQLRRRITEVEDELRKLKRSDTDIVTTPSSSFEDALKLRAPAQQFKISTWDNERKESRAKTSQGGEVVPRSETVSPEAIVPVPDATKSVLSGRRKSAWIAQPGFAISCPRSSAPDALLVGMKEELATAKFEIVSDHIGDIFEHHLRNYQHPHLAFSAAMVSLHSIFLERLRLEHAGSHGSESPGDEIDDACFLRCAELVRHFICKSRFSERPPPRRPSDIERASYVRELCMQAGLSLDLVRLGYAHENSRKHRNPPVTNLTNSAEVESTGTSSSSEGCKKYETCVRREEMQTHLGRAGRYLAAVQMDMDRYRDEFRVQRAETSEQSFPLLDSVPSSASDAVKSSHALVPLEDLHTSVPQDAHSVQQKNVRGVGEAQLSRMNSAESTLSERDSLADTSMDLVSSDVGSSMEVGLRNPLLVPSFGEFLELQVLPLYVVDVPFHRLKALTETYCGISLDSDDEQDAWDAVGLTRPLVNKTARKKRRQTSSANSSLTPASEQPPAHAKLTDLSDLMGKSKAKLAVPVMRAQMLTSIVEKRRKNMRAFRDQAGNAKSSEVVPTPLPSPLVKTARALLHGSTPLPAVTYPECSPLSIRKTSRGRLDLQESVRSTRSVITPARASSRPDWDAM